MPDWLIERLSRAHDRTLFDCGNQELNGWLKERAGQWDRKGMARTYVLVYTGQRTVLGYYALSSHRVSNESLPDHEARGLPRIDVPVVLLGRLAVDRSLQGQGAGELLLMDALKRVQQVADEIGVRAVEVDAIDDAARGFYQKYGFVALKDDSRHLFLPMTAVRRLGL